MKLRCHGEKQKARPDMIGSKRSDVEVPGVLGSRRWTGRRLNWALY